MKTIYQVTIRGNTLESRDLRQLLARAVCEKRNMDRKIRLHARLHRLPLAEYVQEAGQLLPAVASAGN